MADIRAELRHQWEFNHSERCDRRWPHPEGTRCHWPPPEELDDPAVAVLIRLVRDEYPADMSLADIARTWGNATEAEVAALVALEDSLNG